MSATTNNTLTIDWEYWDAQLQAFDALDSGDYDVVVFRGGFGSGKTMFGVRWIIETALATPRSDNLIMAIDFKKGGPTTFKKLFQELPGEDTVPAEGGDAENSPIVAEHNQRDNRVTLVNGSIIRLGSADRWNRYAGSEFNAIHCDEVSHYDTTNLYDLHEMLISRQRTKDGPNVTLWTSTGNGYNDFYDITERRVDQEDNPLPWADTMKVIQANSLHNPFLEEKDKLKRQFGGTERAEQALAGGFAAATGLVYSSFSRNDHVRTDETIPELRNEHYYAYDHGWKDPRVLLHIQKTVHDQYAIVDEFYQTETAVEQAVKWLSSKPEGTIYAEHEPEHIEKFRQAGFRVEAAIKSLDEGIPVVREFLAKDGKGRPGLLVHDDCVNTIQEFLSYKEEHVGKSMATDHAADCVRYLLTTRELDTGSGFYFTTA